MLGLGEGESELRQAQLGVPAHKFTFPALWASPEGSPSTWPADQYTYIPKTEERDRDFFLFRGVEY